MVTGVFRGAFFHFFFFLTFEKLRHGLLLKLLLFVLGC